MQRVNPSVLFVQLKQMEAQMEEEYEERKQQVQKTRDLEKQLQDLQGQASFRDRGNIINPFQTSFVCLFDLIIYIPSTIFQLCRVEPVQS